MPAAKPTVTQKTLTPNKTRTVDEALIELSHFYELGVGSLQEHPGRIKTKDVIKQQGNSHRFDNIRNARALAATWPKTEFRGLLRKCKQHRCPLTKTALIQTLSVPNESDRKAFVDEMIRNRWKVLQTQQAMIARWGRHRVGAGRKALVPADEQALLHRLRSFAERWRRLTTAAETVLDQTGTVGVQDAVQRVTDALANLLQKIGRDFRGMIKEIKGGKLTVQLSTDDPANPNGTFPLRVDAKNYIGEFKRNQLVALKSQRGGSADLSAVLHRLFPDVQDLAGQPLRFYRTGKEWTMTPMSMRPYTGQNS